MEIAVTSTSYVDNHFAKGKHGRLDSWLIRFGFWYIIILSDVEQLEFSSQKEGNYHFSVPEATHFGGNWIRSFAGSTTDS